MLRQVRIEFAGAMYHVMARGDRREPIVQDDEDRRTFVRTLGEACERSGFRVHAYVLMSNHYHLLLETKEANLSQGMGWLQNAFTRRINIRHKLWGHLFGGRYKAILVEPGNCFWALLDYLHLNPVRAGLLQEGDGLESYRWSSLRHYIAVPKMRPRWLETAMAFSVTGCKDTPGGRREFLEMVESRVDWKNPGEAGAVYSEREGEFGLAVHSALRRGWFFGSQEFREMLLKLAARTLAGRAKRKADGYQGAEFKGSESDDLVSGMQWLQTAYTAWFNRRHGLSGHLFGGRYKAVLIDEGEPQGKMPYGYVGTVLEYLHLNPVRAGLVGGRSCKSLLDYLWSSLTGAYICTPRKRPKWTHVEVAFSLFGLPNIWLYGFKPSILRLLKLTLNCDSTDFRCFPNSSSRGK